MICLVCALGLNGSHCHMQRKTILPVSGFYFYLYSFSLHHNLTLQGSSVLYQIGLYYNKC